MKREVKILPRGFAKEVASIEKCSPRRVYNVAYGITVDYKIMKRLREMSAAYKKQLNTIKKWRAKDAKQ